MCFCIVSKGLESNEEIVETVTIILIALENPCQNFSLFAKVVTY